MSSTAPATGKPVGSGMVVRFKSGGRAMTTGSFRNVRDRDGARWVITCYWDDYGITDGAIMSMEVDVNALEVAEVVENEVGEPSESSPVDSAEAMFESVACGAILLDKRFPGWAALVDPDLLDMSCERYDLLGLILGGLEAGCERLGIADKTDCDLWGFDIHIDAHHDDYGSLTHLWRNAITKRVGLARED